MKIAKNCWELWKEHSNFNVVIYRFLMKKKFVLLSVLLNLFFALPTNAEVVRRAALDVGSGGTALTVADVETESNKIVEILYQKIKNVPLRTDLAKSPDGNLSQEIEIKLIAILNEFKDEVSALQPKQWFGVATSVFRIANNGSTVLRNAAKATDIPLYLAPQEEEGIIGFTTALAATGLEASEIIAWDSGAGSFQITALNGPQLEVYGAEFALLGTLELIIEDIRGQVFDRSISPNPINQEEFLLLVSKIQSEKLPQVPSWLAEHKKQFITFGCTPSIFSLGQIATGKEIYTQAELLEGIQSFLGKSDDQMPLIPEPQKKIVPAGLILLYSVMNHIGLEKIIFQETNGNCEGLLIMPQYWEIQGQN